MKKVKNLIVLIIVFTCFTAVAQTKVDTLNNHKIIQLTKLGLQPSVIINKIKISVTSFDLSTDSLIKLNKSGVSQEVINFMFETNKQPQAPAEEVQQDSKDPKDMHMPGIYYYNPNDKDNPLIKLSSTVVSSQQTGGGGYGGFSSYSTISYISGEKSQLYFNESNPIFYFYFDNKSNNGNPQDESLWFASVTNPTEFTLAKLYIKRNKRFFKSGASYHQMYHTEYSNGIPEKEKVHFDQEEVAKGVYKVTFQKPLKIGEYCFVFAGASASNYLIQKVFDFGISK